MQKQFETATEAFEFTVNLGGFRGKKVFEFFPSENKKYGPGSVRELSLFGQSMNVSSATKQGLMLYSFDILGKKITNKIKFEDIELGNTLDK